jgi:hypothetical protein
MSSNITSSMQGSFRCALPVCTTHSSTRDTGQNARLMMLQSCHVTYNLGCTADSGQLQATEWKYSKEAAVLRIYASCICVGNNPDPVECAGQHPKTYYASLRPPPDRQLDCKEQRRPSTQSQLSNQHVVAACSMPTTQVCACSLQTLPLTS